jgi:hypothetical protein
MSEDYVNQLTLNFLISKSQLEKLNKKRNNDKQSGLQIDKTKFREPVLELFNRLFDDDAPPDLLHDVRDSFDLFITKSIYYLKIREQNLDSDLKEEDFVEEQDFVEEEDVEEDFEEEEDVEEVTNVYKKRPNKTKLTSGAESIQKLPLDWFTKSQIISRKKV